MIKQTNFHLWTHSSAHWKGRWTPKLTRLCWLNISSWNRKEGERADWAELLTLKISHEIFSESRPATSGLTELGRASGTRPRPWTLNLIVLTICPSGTMTGARPTKLRAPTPTLTCTPSRSTRTPSGGATTSWCCARRTSTTSCQPTPTRGNSGVLESHF